MSEHEKHKESSPSKGSGAEHYGPIQSPMEHIFGNPKDFSSTGGGVYDGLSAPYEKGTPTKAKELTFDDSGEFGKVPKENK